ncbi:MAG: hypothetical protein ACK53L_24520, partial [Pirellulaceae bacterium]
VRDIANTLSTPPEPCQESEDLTHTQLSAMALYRISGPAPSHALIIELLQASRQRACSLM